MSGSDSEQSSALGELSESAEPPLSEFSERMTVQELSSWLKRNDIPDTFCQMFAGMYTLEVLLTGLPF